MAAERRTLWGVLTLLYTALLLLLTLSPQSEVRGINLVPLEQTIRAARGVLASSDPLHHPTLGYLAVQVVGNVVAFIPFGFVLAGWLRRRSKLWTVTLAVAWGFVLSLLIELAQLAMMTRATDIDDLIFNTFGTALGAGLLVLVIRDPSRRRSPARGASVRRPAGRRSTSR